MKLRTSLFAATFVLMSSASAQQIDKGTLADVVTSVPQETKQLVMADRLVSYGYQTKSALPLVQAVQIFKALNVTDAADDTSQNSPFSESKLLADAKKFADGNKNLLSLIRETEKSTRAGSYDPPLRYFRVIDPGETVTQDLYTKGSQYIQIVVDGQGKGISSRDDKGNILVSDLQLTVIDNKGRVIAADKSRGENCTACFISRTNNMTIAVNNVGKLGDTFIMYVYKTPLAN